MPLDIRNLSARLFRRSGKVPARAPRLALESLEARDVPATLTVSSLGDLTEGGSAGGFRVTRDGDTAQTLYVLVAPSGTATAGTDYTGLASFPSYLSIPAGASYADISLSPIDDADVEGTETITVSAAEYSAMGPGPWASGTISLFDNDTTSGPTVPTITAGTMMNALEGGGWGAFFLYRTGDTSGPLTVAYTVGGTATPGTDYTPLSGTATFAPDNAFAGVFVEALADGIAEPDETVVLDVQAGAGYAVGGPSSATLTITDNTLAVATVADATEGGASGVVRFTRNSALFSTQTVNYAVSGTATPTADYAPLSGSVTFDIGVWSVDVAVAALADDVSDDGETVTVTVAPGFGYVPGVDNSATVIIREPSGSITAVRPDGSEVEEGWGAENNDNDNYNFSGDPDTSLDQIEDKDELDAVAGEDDLVPIHLSPIANAVSGDSTWLSFASSNIRLWMNADKSGGQVTSGMTAFDATQAHTVYAEGLALSSAVNAEVVNLEWSSAANPRRILGQVLLTVYNIMGAQNVPGYSRHTYSATVPGQVAATFGAITGGTQHYVVASKPVAGGAATNNGLGPLTQAHRSRRTPRS